MLGHINSQFFSAVGNSLVPFYTVSSVITAICCGTTILTAQNIGANDTEKSKKYAECSFIGNSIFSLLAFAFFFFCSESLFKLMGVKSPVLEYGTSYLKILSFSLLIVGPEWTATSILQGIGLTKAIMISGITSNIINVVLDWILIYGKFGFPMMGIKGAACATVIADFAAAPIVIIYVFKCKRMPFKLDIRSVMKFKPLLYKNVLRIGVPTGFEYALWNIGNLIAVSFLNRLDMMSAGIYSLIYSIETFPLLLYMGFADAGLTLVGQKTGEKNKKQAIDVGFKCLKLAIIICVAVGVAFCILTKPILGVFSDDKDLIEYSAPYLIFVSFILIPKAVNMVIGLGIRGLGDTRWMLYGQIFGTVLVIVLSYTLIFPAGLGLMGMFITLLADESLRGIFNILRFWKGREFFGFKTFEEKE